MATKKKVSPQDKHRLTVDVGPDKGAILNEMARVTGFTKTAIIRNALFEKMAAWQKEVAR